jgi:hypothetical protein
LTSIGRWDAKLNESLADWTTMFGCLLGCRQRQLRIARTLLLLSMKGTFHGQVELYSFSIVDSCARVPALVWGKFGLIGRMMIVVGLTGLKVNSRHLTEKSSVKS